LKDSIDINVLFSICFALLFFSIVISTILAITLSEVLLAQYGNIKKDICYPIQRLNTKRKLTNRDDAQIIPEGKRLQIVSQNDPTRCMEDVAMPEIRTINGMQNIPSCSTIVSLKASDVIPITKFCIAIKIINNTESNSVGIKSLSGSCDLKIQDKASSIIIISVGGLSSLPTRMYESELLPYIWDVAIIIK
jgi:hypothetical protein